jgi:hypothetical protein
MNDLDIQALAKQLERLGLLTLRPRGAGGSRDHLAGKSSGERNQPCFGPPDPDRSRDHCGVKLVSENQLKSEQRVENRLMDRETGGNQQVNMELVTQSRYTNPASVELHSENILKGHYLEVSIPGRVVDEIWRNEILRNFAK